MKHRLTYSAVLITLLFACNKKTEHLPAPQPSPPTAKSCELICSDKNETWEEIKQYYILEFAGNRSLFRFEGDSVFVKYRWWTDAIVPGDPCDYGETVYSKGTYHITEDSLSITAKITDETYTYASSDCKGNTDFSVKIKYEVITCDSIRVNPDNYDPKYFNIYPNE